MKREEKKKETFLPFLFVDDDESARMKRIRPTSGIDAAVWWKLGLLSKELKKLAF